MSNDEVLAAAGWTMQELLEAALLPWSPMPKKETTEDVSKRGAVNDNQDDDLVYVTERLEQQCISVDLPESNTRFDRKENTPSRNSATRPTLKCEQLAYPLPQAKPSIQCVPESCHLDETLQNGLKLFPHQKEAVLKAVELQRVILAYDMGLGKTLISLVWAQEMLKRFPNCIVVVLCPCTLTENWKRESSSLGFQSAEDLLSPVSSKGPELFISSWAKIPEVREINEKTGGRYSGYLAIFDESHYMQCLRSQRTQTALNLALHPSCRGLILATGTPMKNGRPCNILPLLMAIRHPIARDKMEFEKRYCDAKKTRFCAWDTSGAKNLDELKKRIGPYMLRKTKDECMKDSLPQLSRVEHRIIVSSEALAEYRAIVEEMRLKSKAFHSSGSGSYRQDSSALEALSALRQLSSNAKVAPTALLVVQKLKELGHVVVFAWFKETAHNLSNEIKISSHYSCEVLTGDLNYVERQRLVDNFQAGKLNVLICTYGVGAVGLTLTKSSLVVLLGIFQINSNRLKHFHF